MASRKLLRSMAVVLLPKATCGSEPLASANDDGEPQGASPFNRRSGIIRRVAQGLLVLSALALHYDWPTSGQQTALGLLASSLDDQLLGKSLLEPAESYDVYQDVDQHGKPIAAYVSPALVPLPRVGPTPEFVGLGPWYNSAPLKLASLRGKVVLVAFWTHNSSNSIRTLPYLEAYWARYQNRPFVLVGIHTPEYVFEESPQNVATTVERYGLTFPIAQDDDYATWNAFGNRYWPAMYLIDTAGIVRYIHLGEGGYQETDLAIRSLLAEMGHRPSGPPIGSDAPAESPALGQSPVTYLGARGWSALANGWDEPDGEVHRYLAPPALPLHHYALIGTWRLVEDERQMLAGFEGEILFHARAGEVNLLLGLEPGTPARSADVAVDGRPIKTIVIDRNDFFNLWTGPYGEHEVTVLVHGRGVAAYAFTFGR
ncbi:MAG: redoxin domain-containing protein [Polyangia bacterium]